MQYVPTKYANRMANRADPDKTAQSDLVLSDRDMLSAISLDSIIPQISMTKFQDSS